MFKKLKDKIAEEVKQSPLKFQTSVQQLTQVKLKFSFKVLEIKYILDYDLNKFH